MSVCLWLVNGREMGTADLPYSRFGAPPNYHIGCPRCGVVWAHRLNTTEWRAPHMWLSRPCDVCSDGVSLAMASCDSQWQLPRPMLERELDIALQNPKQYYLGFV